MAGFFSKLAGFFTGYKEIDSDFYDDLEETLVMGDIGIAATGEIMDELRENVRKKRISEPSQCRELLAGIITAKLNGVKAENDYDFEKKKSVVLVVGVNGVGKTTTVGKLAGMYRQQGKKVILAAADTFRAAAIEQLDAWAAAAGVDIIKGTAGGDPGSVIYDAIKAAKARNADMLICDTAGRLHNKKNLMNELSKINSIIVSEYPDAVKETLVVLDGTTGQNAKEQAREFKEVTDVTGIVLTKLDGSAKGGIAIAIEDELSIPVKFIGLGEKISDLEKFDSDKFVSGLLTKENGDNEKNEQ